MRKILLFLAFLVSGILATAQTEFRQLTYKEAIAKAKIENKLIFIDFYTEWCGPCKMMMRDVFPQKIVGDYLNATFVCIKIDAEKGEGPELAKRYKINAYPTFIAIDAQEKVLMTKVGATDDGGQFIAGIKCQIDPNKTPERMKQRYNSGERTADLISTYAAMLMDQVYENRRPNLDKKDEAFRMVKDYFNGLDDKERLAVENLFIYTSFSENTIDEISRFMIVNRNRFAPEAKEAIAERIRLLYQIDIRNYLAVQVPLVNRDYERIKKEIIDLGLNAGNYYSVVFSLIECYAESDLKAFVSMCDREYTRLHKDWQACLIANYTNLIKTDDNTIKEQAARFIRNHLEDMDPSLLYYAATTLMKLEG